jgi:hypothetical protein
LERAKGFEPSTPTLARSCSTPELHPHPLDIWPKSDIGRQTRSYSQKRGLNATTAIGLLPAPGLTFPARPRFRQFALPPWILIAEAAEPPRSRSHGILQACRTGIFGDVAAKIAVTRTMRSVVNLIGFPVIQQRLAPKLGVSRCEPGACDAHATRALALPTAGSGYKSRDSRPTHSAGKFLSTNTGSLRTPNPGQAK